MERAVAALGSDRVLLGSSCSLLHCPVDVAGETALPGHIRNRMAFAVQKCSELSDLRGIFERKEQTLLDENTAVLQAALAHPDSRVEAVRKRAASVTPDMLSRRRPCSVRRDAQKWLNLPRLPTTTIGSFPQTSAIRSICLVCRKGGISEGEYIAAIRKEIADCIAKQEELGLDIITFLQHDLCIGIEDGFQQIGGHFQDVHGVPVF